MKFSLLPKSPFFYRKLEELALKAQESVSLFRKLVEDWNSSHPSLQSLRDLEHTCDDIVHDVMIRLNQTFITPIDREDIHLLATKLDDLVDSVHALSERLLLFRIHHISEELIQMTHILEKAAAEVVAAIGLLKELNSHKLLEHCIKINTLENEGDRAFEKALGNLFIPDAQPLEVIKWKEIYDFLETAVDKCEDIADIILGIVVKYG